MKARFLIIVIVISSLLLLFSVMSLILEKAQEVPPAAIKETDFSKTVPGKSTTADVIRINGKPRTTEVKETKTYFYYETRHSDFKDTVVFERGVELYALENIFDSSEANLNNVLKSYGEHETYYGAGPFLWFVFLEKGVAVETDEKEILKILYFVPQEEEGFSGLFGEELGLTKETPTPEVLRP